jgi:hypothetical protein
MNQIVAKLSVLGYFATMILVVFKILKIITYSWFWIFFPLCISFCIINFGLILLIIFTIFFRTHKRVGVKWLRKKIL